MTTPARELLYRVQHLVEMEGRPIAVHNPHGRPVDELPIIYGFNNGGSPGWFSAALLAEDGTGLGGHVCSHEGYMPNDLGILEGCRPDRHEEFRKHYPDGYRMAFVSYGDVREHAGLNEAFRLNQEQAAAATAKGESDAGGERSSPSDGDANSVPRNEGQS
jgi:hypothetical protein